MAGDVSQALRTAADDGLAALATVVGARPAAKLMTAFESLHQIARAADPELVAAGLPPSKIALLRAAVDLGRRSVGDVARGRRVSGASEVAAYYRATLSMEPVEEFRAMALDVRHRVLKDVHIARGSLTGVEVHPRDTFRQLIHLGAAAVVFCHNHPSGDPSPSRQDVELTARLREVGELCGINVLDHVIVTSNDFVSLADRGWL
jgi:DNA repair protein RadC